MTTPLVLTASIGSRGAHINVMNDHNHPLSFDLKWNEYDDNERTQGQSLAHLIAAAPALLAAATDVAFDAGMPCIDDDGVNWYRIDACEIVKLRAAIAAAAPPDGAP